VAKVLESLGRVPRDAIPPTPPGPEGSNGNGLVRVQRGARCFVFGSLRDEPLEILILLIGLLRLSNHGKTAYNIHFIFHLLLLWRK
jgi:hypothetical protein